MQLSLIKLQKRIAWFLRDHYGVFSSLIHVLLPFHMNRSCLPFFWKALTCRSLPKWLHFCLLGPRNVFHSPEDAQGLSSTARSFLAGAPTSKRLDEWRIGRRVSSSQMESGNKKNPMKIMWAMKKPWLFMVYRGLYYPLMCGIMINHYRILIKQPAFHRK